MNVQKKNTNSQGLPTYANSVNTEDPKYQVRVFNGKPQFRIRKRNDSAKVQGMISRAQKKAQSKNSVQRQELIDDNANIINDYPEEQQSYSK